VLTLLFALPSERIRNLTADQITVKDQHAYLAAGRHPILLPPRLAGLLQRLATQPQERLMISHDQRGPRRLFPGRVPGQPIASHALTTRLNRHGISVRAARNGALAALAADLPVAILADLLGMHVHTRGPLGHLRPTRLGRISGRTGRRYRRANTGRIAPASGMTARPPWLSPEKCYPSPASARAAASRR
jgi:hypothetical protein